ncbi:MAG: 30S ribosomal protein S6 [Dehalococcoidales bacterium]|nr:30S ribosomal protein S6 [Dehalococcoidales bacterium]
MAKKKQEPEVVVDTKLEDYELVYIVRPEVADDALEARVDTVSQFITAREGVVDDVQKWGKRKLAYPIKHCLEGNYILTRFKMGPSKCRELEVNLEISEEILRHLLIKVGN